MLGVISGVLENTFEVFVKTPSTLNFMNKQIIVENGEGSLLLGEPLTFKNNILTCQLIGHIKNGRFGMGSAEQPILNKNVRQITDEEVKLVLASDGDKYQFEIGHLPIYNNMPYYIKINDFFSNHFAILGNTGSGKSCSVSRILQNVYRNAEVTNKTNVIIFDAFGEYESAFSNIEGVTLKKISTDLSNTTDEILRIPLWLLGVDDIALLLQIEKPSELNIIEKALKFVNVFAKDEATVIQQKNSIISKTVLDVINSGKPAPVLRDQIIAILSTFNTSTLNLESQVVVPGWTRTLKQCLIIDKDGKMAAIEVLTEFIHSFIDNSVELSLPDQSFPYTLDDLSTALDFALVSEGMYNSEKRYDDLSVLSLRLNAILNSDSRHYFDFPYHISRDLYINNLLTTEHGKASIVNFNINQIDDRFAKTIVKIFSKLFFDTATEIQPRGTVPFHIILEEAHRYVQNDLDEEILGYNIFNRITKEGRKYGVLLGLITQRPSELSETAISQCTNFITLRIVHPKDLHYISQMIPYMTAEGMRKLQTLPAGHAYGFGNAFKLTTLIEFEMPNPAPTSHNSDVAMSWFNTTTQ